MRTKTLALNNQLYDYLFRVSVREHVILKELREKTMLLPAGRMQITPEQGQFMALLLELIGAKKVLEIGVFTGYSALAMALALPADGQLIACDISEKWTTIAKDYWLKANVAHKIQLILSPAADTLNSLLKTEKNSFDCIFIDADKQKYDFYYEKALMLLRRGGLIMIDNTLWSGKIANPDINDFTTQALRALNEKLHCDERITLSLIPVGDGLTLARKL